MSNLGESNRALLMALYTPYNLSSVWSFPPQGLSYEMFQAALVHAASRLMRPEAPCLSEGVREYLGHLLGKAGRIAPASGSRRGGVGSIRPSSTSIASSGSASLTPGSGGVMAGGKGATGAGSGTKGPSGRGSRPPSPASKPPKRSSQVGPSDATGNVAAFSFPDL